MGDQARFIVGIDLGTTRTVVAFADTGTEETTIASLAIDQLVAPGEIAGRSMLPSVRYHVADGELTAEEMTLPWGDAGEDPPAVVGALGLELGRRVPGRLVTSAKSWLSHSAVDRTAPILPWGAPDDIPKVSPVEASASYLRHVRSAWDTKHPAYPITHAGDRADDPGVF